MLKAIFCAKTLCRFVSKERASFDISFKNSKEKVTFRLQKEEDLRACVCIYI